MNDIKLTKKFINKKFMFENFENYLKQSVLVVIKVDNEPVISTSKQSYSDESWF